MQSVFGIDTQPVLDGTYFVVEEHTPPKPVVACGGWSKRRTLYGADRCAGREDTVLNPATDAAKIRAFFVHPEWARRGVGSVLLEACEHAALAAGFTRFEMGATLTGAPLYSAKGYTPTESLGVPLPNGDSLPIVRMEKTRLPGL